MLFKKLAGLLAGNTVVTLMVTGKEEELTVTVIPKPEKSGEGREALAAPLVLTGTADELDAGFCDLLEKFSGSRKSLAEQFEATEAVLEAAKKASSEKAAKAVTKSAKASTKPAVKVPGAAKTDATDTDNDEEESSDDTGAEATVTQAGQAAPSENLFG